MSSSEICLRAQSTKNSISDEKTKHLTSWSVSRVVQFINLSSTVQDWTHLVLEVKLTVAGGDHHHLGSSRATIAIASSRIAPSSSDFETVRLSRQVSTVVSICK